LSSFATLCVNRLFLADGIKHATAWQNNICQAVESGVKMSSGLRSTGVPVPILQRARVRAIVRISPVGLQVQTATGAAPEWCDAIHPRTPLWRRRAG